MKKINFYVKAKNKRSIEFVLSTIFLLCSVLLLCIKRIYTIFVTFTNYELRHNKGNNATRIFTKLKNYCNKIENL